MRRGRPWQAPLCTTRTAARRGLVVHERRLPGYRALTRELTRQPRVSLPGKIFRSTSLEVEERRGSRAESSDRYRRWLQTAELAGSPRLRYRHDDRGRVTHPRPPSGIPPGGMFTHLSALTWRLLSLSLI